MKAAGILKDQIPQEDLKKIRIFVPDKVSLIKHLDLSPNHPQAYENRLRAEQIAEAIKIRTKRVPEITTSQNLG